MAATSSEEMSDRDLARAWAEGDEHSFEILVGRFAPLVYKRCRRSLNDADADDATQAVFLVLARKGAQVAGHAAPAAWLMTVANHVICHAHRDRKRRERAELGAPRPAPVDAGESVTKDVTSSLDACLGELPIAEQEAVILHYLAGYSLAQVAERCNAGVSTIKDRLRRGLERLRTRLRSRGVEVSTMALITALEAEAAAEVPATALSHLQDLLRSVPEAGTNASLSTSALCWSRRPGGLHLGRWMVVSLAIAIALIAWSAWAGTRSSVQTTVQPDPSASVGSMAAGHADLIPILASASDPLDLDAAVEQVRMALRSGRVPATGVTIPFTAKRVVFGKETVEMKAIAISGGTLAIEPDHERWFIICHLDLVPQPLFATFMDGDGNPGQGGISLEAVDRLTIGWQHVPPDYPANLSHGVKSLIVSTRQDEGLLGRLWNGDIASDLGGAALELGFGLSPDDDRQRCELTSGTLPDAAPWFAN